MPRVSVIVPAYQAAGHLAGALDSVVAQGYQDWEAIVADDGSTDATSEIAGGYGERVRVVRSDVNRGLAATRNLALAHATGELIALLDSDDRWLPDYLSEQVALYDAEQARSTDVGIVCCDALLEGAGIASGQRYSERFGAPPAEVDAPSLLRANAIFVSVLAPRAVIEEVGGFEPSLRSIEDLDLWLRIVEGGFRVVYNPRPLAVYRIAPGTLSRDVLRMTRSRQVVFRRALERGRLSPAGQRAAHEALRLERAAELVELARRHGRRRPLRTAAGLVVCAPLLARVAYERILARRRRR
jgi:glycosyltransferase involved in cell wall biosynthesis